ncbi:MAG: response regulator [Deltaproteobacteria bacterium]|nr:response regulator [Deltaproteobacteria bacterium]
MSARIRVLIVDDSAFARKVVRESLAADPAIEVLGTARDGLDALEKIAALSPDVITLDLVMPNLDGLGLLEAALQHPEAPRVVVCVVLTGMGDDGLLGARAVVAGRGRVLTQSALSCVVYGMPRAVAEAGLSAGVVGLDEMAGAIARAL